jgi:tripartite-type tricarboxylate transporter receptor subunit TctC
MHGLYAPAATPREIVARLHAEADKALRSPEALKVIGAVSAEPVYATPEAFAAQLRSDRERYGAIVRAAAIKAE